MGHQWHAGSDTRSSNVTVSIKRNTNTGILRTSRRRSDIHRSTEGEGQEVKGVLAAAVELIEAGETNCAAEYESTSLPAWRERSEV